MTTTINDWLKKVARPTQPGDKERVTSLLTASGWDPILAGVTYDAWFKDSGFAAPTKLLKHGHRTFGQSRLLMSLKAPAIDVIASFLTDDECAQLVDEAEAELQASTVVDVQTGGSMSSSVRTSAGMFFPKGVDSLANRVIQRAANYCDIRASRFEGMQVLRYKPGQEYLPHHDYFNPALPGTPALLSRGGNRVATFLMYLNTVTMGGETSFPDLGLTVEANTGVAVYFQYPDCTSTDSRLTRHAGCPVIVGTKYVAVLWIRENDFA